MYLLIHHLDSKSFPVGHLSLTNFRILGSNHLLGSSSDYPVSLDPTGQK